MAFYTFAIFTTLVVGCTSLWIGEEYWTIVNKDGSLRGRRSMADFLTFNGVTAKHNGHPVPFAWVAFLITYDDQGHYETFGQAYRDYDRVCAQFVDRKKRHFKRCGGFRVLSRRADGSERINPFKFVKSESANLDNVIEYRGKQVAMISSWRFEEGHYGSADMRTKNAQAVDYDGQVIQVSFSSDPYFFNKRIFLLTRLSPNEYEAHTVKPPPAHPRAEVIYHTPEEDQFNPDSEMVVQAAEDYNTDWQDWQFFH